MKHFQKFQWLGFILLLMAVVVGCEMFGDSDLSSPVGSTEIAPNTGMLANFWVGRGQNKFEVFSGNEVVQVGTPEGDYLLKYSVKIPTKDGGFEIQEFSIVFTAEEGGASLVIGLKPGDEIWEVQLIPGDVPEGATPVIEKEGVAIFLWPEDESSFSLDDFEMPEDEDLILIILIADGLIAPVIVDDDGIEININIEIVINGELQVAKYTITTNVIPGTVGGTITPEELEGVPFGSSRSFKIHPNSGIFDDIEDVTVNGESVIAYVQDLGNGDGHLVIHGISENLEIEVTFK